MAKYKVLRDCFTGDCYYAKGNVVELDEKVVKNPKNFAPVTPPVSEKVVAPEVHELPSSKFQGDLPSNFKVIADKSLTTPSTGEVQSVTPVKEFKCSVCGKVVSSALALSGHSRSHKEVKNET